MSKTMCPSERARLAAVIHAHERELHQGQREMDALRLENRLLRLQLRALLEDHGGKCWHGCSLAGRGQLRRPNNVAPLPGGLAGTGGED